MRLTSAAVVGILEFSLRQQRPDLMPIHPLLQPRHLAPSLALLFGWAELATAEQSTAALTAIPSEYIELLTGDSNASLARATLNSDAPISATLLAAMRQPDSAGGSSTRSNAPRLVAGNDPGGRIWVQALGYSGKLDGEYLPLQHTTQGLVVGADWPAGDQWRVGVMGGKSRTHQQSSELD